MFNSETTNPPPHIVKMQDCQIADLVATGLVGFIALISHITIAWKLPSPVIVVLTFFFVLVGVLHVALRYVPDPTHDVPQWLSVLTPMLISAFVLVILRCARWLVGVVVITLVVLMSLQYFTPIIGVVLALVVCVFLCIASGLCCKAPCLEKAANGISMMLVSVLTSFLLTVVAFAIYKISYGFNSDVECTNETNVFLLCDYRCASITSDGQWQINVGWLCTFVALLTVRYLVIAACGVETFRMYWTNCGICWRKICCYNGFTQQLDDDIELEIDTNANIDEFGLPPAENA